MDGLYFFLVAVSAFFTVLIFATIFVFAIKYRRENNPHPTQIEGSLPLELTWTLIPLGICMIFFAWGSLIYFQEGRAPRGAMEVYASASSGCGSLSMIPASARSITFTCLSTAT